MAAGKRPITRENATADGGVHAMWMVLGVQEAQLTIEELLGAKSNDLCLRIVLEGINGQIAESFCAGCRHHLL